MKKFLVILLSFYLSIVFFMPKEQLLFTALNQTSKQNLNYRVEDLSDYGFFESIKRLTIYFDKGELLEVDDTKIYPFLFFNKLTFSQIHILGSFRKLLNIKIIEVSLTNTILSPTTINIYANSTIGELRGSFDIDSNRLKVILEPNDKFNSFKYKNYFKKTEEGYIYETRIQF